MFPSFESEEVLSMGEKLSYLMRFSQDHHELPLPLWLSYCQPPLMTLFNLFLEEREDAFQIYCAQK